MRDVPVDAEDGEFVGDFGDEFLVLAGMGQKDANLARPPVHIGGGGTDDVENLVVVQAHDDAVDFQEVVVVDVTDNFRDGGAEFVVDSTKTESGEEKVDLVGGPLARGQCIDKLALELEAVPAAQRHFGHRPVELSAPTAAERPSEIIDGVLIRSAQPPQR